MMIIGLDLNVVRRRRDQMAFFSELTRLMVTNGNEVHLVTEEPASAGLEHRLREEMGLVWTHLFSVPDHLRRTGVTVEYVNGTPQADETAWHQARADYCSRAGIHLHLDDSPVSLRYFATPCARYYPRPVAEKRKIAIVGGSFNPVTNAHLAVAETVLQALPELHDVWFMPAYRHPFEKHSEYEADRARMIRMVETEQIRYFGYEIDNRLTGETYLTFNLLLQDPAYKDICDFYMVIGSDCVFEFDEKWKYADRLAEMVRFIVVPRPGYSLEGYHGLLSKPPHRIVYHADLPDISSTEVRTRRRSNESIEGLVPEPVREFILAHDLYRRRCEKKGGNEHQDQNGHRHAGEGPEKGNTPDGGKCRRPAVTVDIGICTIKDDSLKVLLVKRNTEPFQGCWSIPGGFLDVDRQESLEETAERQLAEETGLTDIYFEQLKTYGNPGRYPGMRVVTTSYFALVPFDKLSRQNIRTAGNSTEAKWFSLKDYPKELEFLDGRLAFDHDQILQDLLKRIQGKISYTPIAFELVPEKFTWPELRMVYEIILDKRIDATNFKRKIRSMYRIRDLKSRQVDNTVGRPPQRLRFEGVKEIYV